MQIEKLLVKDVTNTNGQLQVIVVYKRSRLNLFSDKHRISSTQRQSLQEADDKHRLAIGIIENKLKNLKAQYVLVAREDLSKKGFLPSNHLILCVGGDGTVLQASHHIADIRSPLIGINSDPKHSMGMLCCASIATLEANFESLAANQLELFLAPRIHAHINEQPIFPLILNDILIASMHPAETSRYEIESKSTTEQQKSSGIWFATALGSTGAIASAGSTPKDLDYTGILMHVREPYCSFLGYPALLNQSISASETISITSHMLHGALFIDGTNAHSLFNIGDNLRLEMRLRSIALGVSSVFYDNRQRLSTLIQQRKRNG